MTYEFLIQEKGDGGLVTLTLNRPDKRNALSAALRDEIGSCIEQLSVDETVKAIILTGAGDVFCGGFDLKELAGGHTQEIFAEARAYHRRIYTCPKPIVAAVNGGAFAGGMDLASMCDLRIAAEDAVFAQPQVKMGVPAAFDLTKTLMPESLARELCLTGRRMDAREALDAGYITGIVPGEKLMAEALKLALDIAAASASGTMKSAFVKSQPGLFDA